MIQRLLRSLGRVLWFALAGAICMALVGVVAGSVTGALIIFLENLTRVGVTKSVFNDVPTGALFGAAYAVFTGLWSGAVAFGVAGVFACLSTMPQKVFSAAWRLAWRATIIGVLIGAVLGPINSVVLQRFTTGTFADPLSGYMYGVIAGFALGTLCGAIVGARRETAQQKSEWTQQNAPPSNIESGANIEYSN